MKKALSLFLSIVLVLGVFLSVPFTGSSFKITAEAASSGTCGTNVNWSLDNGVLTISGTGAMTNYSSSSSVPWYSSKSSIKAVVINKGVTSIGDYAFYYCTSLTSVTIPDSVTSIGDDAFCLCKSLTAINVSSSNQYYTSVDGVLFNKAKTELIQYPVGKTNTSYTIPNSVTSIGDEAFQYCYNLTSITIPGSVTSIGYSAFWDSSLTSITIPSSVARIGSDAFMGCDSLTAINVSSSNQHYTSVDGVLFNKNKTELIQYPASKTNASFTIPNSVTSIGRYAFYYCTHLTSLTIPDSVTSIGYAAFSGCDSLTSLKIGNGVTSIGYYAFQDCESLISITIPDSVTSIGMQAFSNCESLTSVTIGDSVASIGENAFGMCYSLESVVIGNSVKSIGDYAFNNCTSLAYIFYTGFQEEWSSISIGAGNGSITNATIHYGSTGHTVVISSSKTPTCTETGLTEGSHCSVCNAVIIAQDIVPAMGHRYYGEYIITSNATCTANGSKYRICGVCSERETQTIPATGHTAVIDTSKAPTCTETGLTEGSHCSVCGKVFTAQNVVAVIAHAPSNWITDKVATCTVAGSRHKECTVCGNTLETAVIPQLTCAAPTLSSAMNANGGVTVTWKAVSGADSYRVYRKTSSSDWNCISSKVTSTSYTDKAAKSGTTYYYTVKAENEAGLSEYNLTGISIKHLAMPTVTVANAATGVKVSWNKIAGAAGYYVYRKANGEWTQCATISDGSTVSYTDTNRKTGSTYSYSVMAYDSTTTSDYNSTGVSVKYLAMPTVTIANASTGVKVSWNKITGASKYYVYRKASGDKSWTQLTNSATGTSYTDTKAKSGTTYYYTVKAVSGSISSEYKSSSALKYLAQPKVSSLSNTNSGITVKWNKITGASGYYVYRKTGSGSWSLIYTVKSGSTVSYTDKSAKAGTTYYYTVRAYSGSVKSTYTASSAVRRLTTPSLKSVSSAKSGITFKWSKVTGASGYYVYRKTGSGSWQKIATVKSGSTVSYLDKTAKKGTTYTYTVKAYYSSNVSAYNTTGLKIKDKY